MQSFKDGEGKAWDIHLTIGRAKLLKSRLELDLVGGDPSTVAQQLIESPLLRMDALWLMVSNKDERTQEDFDEQLGAGTFREADAAFWEEIANFTQSLDPVRSQAIQTLKAKMQAAAARQVEVLVEIATSPQATNKLEEAIEQAKDAAYKTIAGISYTNLREDLESFPTR